MIFEYLTICFVNHIDNIFYFICEWFSMSHKILFDQMLWSFLTKYFIIWSNNCLLRIKVSAKCFVITMEIFDAFNHILFKFFSVFFSRKIFEYLLNCFKIFNFNFGLHQFMCLIEAIWEILDWFAKFVMFILLSFNFLLNILLINLVIFKHCWSMKISLHLLYQITMVFIEICDC